MLRAGAAVVIMPYWRLHYHLVWTTFGRLPVLTADLGPAVYRSVCARAKRLGVILHAIGGVEDHVHVVASVPPRIAVAECAWGSSRERVRIRRTSCSVPRTASSGRRVTEP